MLHSFLEQQRRQHQQAGSTWGSCSDWIPAHDYTFVKLPLVTGLGSQWSLWTLTLLGAGQFSVQFSKPTQIHEHKTHHSQHDPSCCSCIWCCASNFLFSLAVTASRSLKIRHWCQLPGEGHLKGIASDTCGHKPCAAQHCAYQKSGKPKEERSEVLPLSECMDINTFCLVALTLITISDSLCYSFFVNLKQRVAPC